MAADDMSNKEIAHALFVTPKTVESHLGASIASLTSVPVESSPQHSPP
jgi:DNA-binding CsgD family transcriptional regulator